MTDPATTHGLTHRQAVLLTAHHEAAHAVVALHLGLTVDHLNIIQTIDEDGAWNVGGITYVVYHPSRADHFALQGAAGGLAAMHWLQKNRLDTDANSAAANADHDRHDIHTLLDNDGIHTDWNDVRRRSHDLVQMLWPQITAVAHDAATHPRMTGTEITEVLDDQAHMLADQILGLDNDSFTGDWHKALQDTAARWACTPATAQTTAAA